MGAPLKVVLDTNVLISGLLWQGNTQKVFILLRNGKIAVCVSQEITKEFRRVLEYPKFKKRLNELEITPSKIIDEFLEIVEYYSPIKLPHTIIKADPSDDKFLSCALAAKASYIAS